MTLFDFMDKHPYISVTFVAWVFTVWCATVEEIAKAIKSRK